MTEQIFTIDTGTKLLHIDADESGNYIAINEDYEIITNTFRTRISHEIKVPNVKLLSDTLFLVMSYSVEKQTNAFIYNREGQLLSSFYAGYGILDILVFNHCIVFTYCDEGVFADSGPNLEGLTVFNFQGEMLYGFNSHANWLIADCYCACKMDEARVLFYPYTDFQMIALDVTTFRWEQYDTPRDFLGASSMTYKDGQVILHSTYKNKKDFFLWDMQQQQVTIPSAFNGYLKGLSHGKFIHPLPTGFNIIDPLEEA
jgi:hypothetical protein